MNIEVKRGDLLHALAAADGIARPNGQMPLLECVLITARGKDAVSIEATDVALTISAEIKSINAKAGSIAINAKRLRDVIKNAPAGEVSIAMIDNGWVEIKAGKARYKLASINGRDFPKIHSSTAGKSATFDGDVLKQMIDRVLFSASEDKTRMALNGALFSAVAGVAAMVTTDGHRMSRATCSCESAAAFSAIVPRDALAKLARIVEGETDVIVEKGRIYVRTAGLVMSSALAKGSGS